MIIIGVIVMPVFESASCFNSATTADITSSLIYWSAVQLTNVGSVTGKLTGGEQFPLFNRHPPLTHHFSPWSLDGCELQWGCEICHAVLVCGRKSVLSQQQEAQRREQKAFSKCANLSGFHVSSLSPGSTVSFSFQSVGLRSHSRPGHWKLDFWISVDF